MAELKRVREGEGGRRGEGEREEIDGEREEVREGERGE